MKMYTIDGNEVFVVKKIEDGYLAKIIYCYNGYDSEDDNELEAICNEIVFYDQLFEQPPTHKYADEVKKLKKEIDSLHETIRKLVHTKNAESAAMSKIHNYPFIQTLVDYLNGDFKYYIALDGRYQIDEKNSVYLTTKVKAVNTKSGWGIYKLRSEGYESYDDFPFMIFQNMEDAIAFCKSKLIETLEQYKKHQYTQAKSIKEIHDKIWYKNPVKEDPEYLQAYNETLNYIIEREKIKEAEKIKAEIEELENKKKKLQELNQS